MKFFCKKIKQLLSKIFFSFNKDYSQILFISLKKGYCMKLKYCLLAIMLAISLFANQNVKEPKEPQCTLQPISNSTPYRLLANKDPQGWNIEMDDGSIWRAVNSSGAHQIAHWRTNDPLVIHPTFSPNWSGGRFYIHNQRLNSAAVVELSNRATNSLLTYIDPSSGVIQIQDSMGRSSYFRLDYADRSSYQKWRPGQSIILGSNEDCWAGFISNYQLILINVECNNFACANLD